MFRIFKRTPTMAEKYAELWQEIQELNLGITGSFTFIDTMRALVKEIKRLREVQNGAARK